LRRGDLSLFRSRSALLKGKGVEDFLWRTLPLVTFEALKIPLRVVATDFWARRQVVLDSGELIPAIRASIALPAIFEAVILADRVLVDGGAVNPVPYDILGNDCDITVAIDASGEKTREEGRDLPNLFESVTTTFQIMEASIVEAKMGVCPPDVYARPALRGVRIGDFERYKEILQGVQPDVERFKEKLAALL
jgi:NTE family protein